MTPLNAPDSWDHPAPAFVAERPSVIEPCDCVNGGWLAGIVCRIVRAANGKPDTMGALYGWRETRYG